MSTNGGSSFLKGVIFGGFIGEGLALLYAPKPGKEMREEIKKKSTELRVNSEGVITDAKTVAGILQAIQQR